MAVSRDREMSMSRRLDGIIKDLGAISAKSLYPRQQQDSVTAPSESGRGRMQTAKHSKSPARVSFARMPLNPLPLEITPL